jgi:hypothetical protein
MGNGRRIFLVWEILKFIVGKSRVRLVPASSWLQTVASC